MRYRFSCAAESPSNSGLQSIEGYISICKSGWLIGFALQSHSGAHVSLMLLLCYPQGVVLARAFQGGFPSHHMPAPAKEKGDKRASPEITHVFSQIPELRHMTISSCKGS